MFKTQPVPSNDQPGQDAPARNPAAAFDADLIESVRVNRSAAERRVATLPKRRTVKKQWQAAWLVKAVQCIDLTTLAGDDTPGRVQRLCAKARQPVRQDLLDAMGIGGITTGAVCVYHAMVEAAVAALQGTGIPVAAVSAGFPAGLSPLPLRLKEIEASVAAGAREIDIVLNRSNVLTGNYRAVYDEVRAFREACGPAHLKTIIGAGDLGTLINVGRASLACMMAGADFIKTSTGKESVNATLPFALVMVRMIRAWREQTGFKVGFKPAGGISTAKDAMSYQFVMKEELGNDWLQPNLFRIGASSLLTDIERQLDHFVSGRYSSAHRHPMG
ncbi:MAG: deoxyribose-phosphate aldolase [Alphaproteobacteria bacterium]|nr:deoxyribose-phosphate aldolase [Alphaproteobacteria bacterium]MDE2629517.1 deoxyribose-phosphate aldolase [Alphaproteobacteria bacterium]